MIAFLYQYDEAAFFWEASGVARGTKKRGLIFLVVKEKLLVSIGEISEEVSLVINVILIADIHSESNDKI